MPLEDTTAPIEEQGVRSVGRWLDPRDLNAGLAETLGEPRKMRSLLNVLRSNSQGKFGVTLEAMMTQLNVDYGELISLINRANQGLRQWGISVCIHSGRWLRLRNGFSEELSAPSIATTSYGGDGLFSHVSLDGPLPEVIVIRRTRT